MVHPVCLPYYFCATVWLTGCNWRGPMKQFACEGRDLYINCGDSVIHVLDANYGRLDQNMCGAGQLSGTTSCRFDATCIARKW